MLNKRIRPIFHRFIISLIFVLFVYWLYTPFLIDTEYANQLFFGWLFIIVSIFVLLPKWIQTFFGVIILITLSITLWFQSVYFRAFGQFGRLSSLLSSKDELISSFKSVEEFFVFDDWRYVWIVLIFLSISIILNLLTKKITLKEYSIVLILFALSFTYGWIQISQFNSTITEDKESTDAFLYYKTTHYIYTNVPNTLQFVEDFGVFGLLQKDIYDQFIGPISNNESDENNQISAFLLDKEISSSNNYSGSLEGKSVLMIEAESLIQAAINPVLTPNLYRLQTYGYNFVNFNAPLLPGSTSDTELMANTSLLPVKTGENTFMNYASNVYPITLASTFTDNGYISMAAHNNYAEFYNRNEMLPALGYDFFDSYRMGFEGQMIIDSEFLNPIKWISIEQDRFFSYWITFNAHQPYSLEEMNPLFQEDYNWVNQLYPNLPEAEKVYLAKTMDFDRSLGSLIIDFTNSGRIDDLVIIIFGDHFAKGAFSEEATTEMFCDQTYEECVSTPFIIWNNDQFIGISDKVSNPLDILPTTFDLMGFEYNQTFVLGYSLFDENYDGFYFNDYGSLVFSDFSYNLLTQELSNPNNLSQDEIEQKIQEAQLRLNLGSLIIENDYFSSKSCQTTFVTCKP